MTQNELIQRAANDEIIGNGRQQIAALLDRLKQIDQLIFAVGAPLGSDLYFEIRTLCNVCYSRPTTALEKDSTK